MKQSRNRRLRILYLLLVILIGISVLPLWFYGSRMLEITKQTLETQEGQLQLTISQSLARETSLYIQNLHQQFDKFYDVVVRVAPQIKASQYASDPQLRTIAEGFVTDQPAEQPPIIYVTVLNQEGRGPAVQTHGYDVGADDFLRKALEAAFTAAHQGTPFESNPLTILRSGVSEPVMVIARPIGDKEHFLGMVAAVVTLGPVVKWMPDRQRREAYIVDSSGRVVASNHPAKYPTRLEMVSSPIVQNFLSLRGQVLATQTSKFELLENGKQTQMLGTYSPIPTVNWGVIVQRELSKAYTDIELDTLRKQTMWLALLLILVNLIVGSYSARTITRPIDNLTRTARSIAQRDFTQRADVRSRTEIGELAETFNQMAEDIQHYILDLKTASEENRQLFMESIEALAAAVDAKDPYTKGHSKRVSQYSVILAKELGLAEEEVDKVLISATLHDVGKIGIEDRVLKKPGVLTNEEFEIMKRHTVMGYEIVRQIKKLQDMLPGIRWHHEALNGKGYPDGLTGDELPLMVRIIAVADTFDAVTTDRPYQAGREFPGALEILRKHAGTKYDPIVVDALHAAYSKGDLRKHEVRRGSLISVPQAAS